MDNAYMIRNDGKLFPEVQHIYGHANPKNPEDYDETLDAGEWLYNHTKSDKTRKQVLAFIHSWAVVKLNNGELFADVITMQNSILNYISEQPYLFLSVDFVKSHRDEIFNSNVMSDVDGFNNMLCEELNQEFLRARYGGMYNTDSSSKEMVFRISSTDFDWFNIIYMFVAEHATAIKSVTVCADEESTGRSDYFYEYKGRKFQQMPVDDFLSMSGTPIMESLQAVKTVPLIYNGILFSHGLSQGYSIMESLNTRKNINRVVHDYMRMRAFHLPYSFIRDK